MTAADWPARYVVGERDAVWRELRALGDDVRLPEHRPLAQAVCDAAAERARRNVIAIVRRLAGQGYRFHENDARQTPTVPHAPPSDRAAAHAAWLDERFGGVPLLLLSWVRLVGDVWLVGTHPEWPDAAAADPIVVEVEGGRYPAASIGDSFDEEHEAWREWADTEPDAGPFVLPLAPDRLHKANISGGDPYGVVVPDRGVDGTWSGEVAVSFVDYLNEVFRAGGFPGVGADPAGVRITRDLARDLLPI